MYINTIANYCFQTRALVLVLAGRIVTESIFHTIACSERIYQTITNHSTNIQRIYILALISA